MKAFVKRLAVEDHGTVSIEYAILLGLITVGVITAVTTIGTWVNGKFTTTAGSLP